MARLEERGGRGAWDDRCIVGETEHADYSQPPSPLLADPAAGGSFVLFCPFDASLTNSKLIHQAIALGTSRRRFSWAAKKS